MKYKLTLLIFFFTSIIVNAQNPNAIIGKWLAYPKKNVIIDVFRDHDEFKGKLIWFNDNDDKTKPMNVRLDEKNPDPKLRSRKVIGLEVLNHLYYNPKNKRWENGKIYDAKSGRTWDTSAFITKDSTLEVRGFWHWEIIGENMKFKRV